MMKVNWVIKADLPNTGEDDGDGEEVTLHSHYSTMRVREGATTTLGSRQL